MLRCAISPVHLLLLLATLNMPEMMPWGLMHPHGKAHTLTAVDWGQLM